MAETAAPAKPKNEADRIEGMLGALNPGDKILVYRIVVDPTTGKETRPVKTVLTEFQGVEDLEAWLYAMAAEQHWPAGEYLLDHRKTGVHGSHCQAKISLEPPPAPASTTGNGAQPSALELVKQAKEILGLQPSANPDTVLQSVTAALKVGADAAGARTPPQDGTLVILKPVLEALAKKLGEAPAAPVAAPDPFVFLERLKTMGLIGKTAEPEQPKTLVEQIGELEQLADVISGLRGPVGPAVEPTAIAVAKIFAPYVPQVLTTINNVVDVVKMRFGMGGPFMPSPAPPPTTPRAVGPSPVPAAVQVLITRTQAAIATDDDGFFPVFADGIVTHIVDGRNFLLAIQSGQVEEEQALVAVQGTGLLNPADPRTRAWLIRFVHWLRAAQPMAAASSPAAAASASPPVANAVIARCERCAQEYRFDAREDFDQDTRICDSEIGENELCKGNIVLLTPDGGAP